MCITTFYTKTVDIYIDINYHMGRRLFMQGRKTKYESSNEVVTRSKNYTRRNEAKYT